MMPYKHKNENKKEGKIWQMFEKRAELKINDRSINRFLVLLFCLFHLRAPAQ